MKKAVFGSLFAVVFLLAQSNVFSEEWKILGPRALGMGGAYVAVADGPLAQYWNPAGMAQPENGSGLSIPAGLKVEFTGKALDTANQLGDLSTRYQAVQAAQNAAGGSVLNAQQMDTIVQGMSLLDKLNESGSGALLNAAGGVNLKFSRFALSVNNYTSVGASPFVDNVNIGLGAVAGSSGSGFTVGGNTSNLPAGSQDAASAASIKSAIDTIGLAAINNMICGSASCSGVANSQALANALVHSALSSGVTSAAIATAASNLAANAAGAAPVINAASGAHPYSQNTSNLTIRAGSFTEFAVGYAKQAFWEGFKVGGNIKMVRGQIGYKQFDILQKEAGTNDVFKDFNKNLKTSMKPALDLGIHYETPGSWHPHFGLVWRNVNNPSFDQPASAPASESKYKLGSQMRAGVAINPFTANWWTLAMDLDLTKNDTSVEGYKSRLWSLGNEFNIFNSKAFNIPLRIGLMKNVADTNSKMAVTAGTGLNFLHLIFEVSGEVSPSTTTINKDKVPYIVGGAASLSILF